MKKLGEISVSSTQNNIFHCIDTTSDHISDDIQFTIRFLELIIKSKVMKIARFGGPHPLTGKEEVDFIAQNGKLYKMIDGEGIYEISSKLIAQ